MSVRKVYQEFVGMNILGVTVEHNGLCGGDAGHGGFVSLTFRDIGSTAMYINGMECDVFEVCFKGDSERDTLIKALEMVLSELNSHERV
jgi:hypothetical protein